MKLAVLALACLLAAAAAGPSDAQAPPQPPKAQRLALVIGNGAYRDSPLPNPTHDAADMAKALEASGFTVLKRENATLREMHLALREFGDRLGRQATGLFYFAGHGMQVRGRNYLLPVDADIAREDEVAFNALDLGAVMEKLDSAKNPVNIVVLDACRDNPFGNRLHASAKGLAPIDAPPGTFIAYATAPGSTAADGAGRNGLYTHHLVQQIGRPGLAIEEVFKAVRAGVRADSKNLQVPWESTSLESAFAFRQKPPEKVAKAPMGAPAGKSAARATAVPPSGPPAFSAGDNWTYRLVNQLDQSERTVVHSIKEIRGDEVRYANGNMGDLMGNNMRVVRPGGRIELYKPTNYFYVFPLKAGADWEAKVVHEVGNRTSDLAVRMKVIGEEAVEMPWGKVRAMKIERESRWKYRDNKGSGVRKWTYWYNAGVKRFVRGEDVNTTTEGKVLSHERWELVRYEVK
jgi:uncharacterized caspase-like protein